MPGIGRRGGCFAFSSGYFGGTEAEGVAGRRERVPTAAVGGAAAQAPAAAPAQWGPAVLDLRESVVRRLAQFASHCETRDSSEVASARLACLLVLAIESGAEEGATANFPGASSAHPANDR
jgi:hypothetical protein